MNTETDTWLARIDARARNGARNYRATGHRRVIAESMKNSEGDLIYGLYHYDLVEADGTFAGAYTIENHGSYWKLQKMTAMDEGTFFEEADPYHADRKEDLVAVLHDWANGGMQP